MQRYIILLCAVIMQMCLGATYSWSIYVTPLKELTGLSQGLTQLPFSLFYFAFPGTMILSGSFILPRFGPRWCAVAGGVIFGGGWLLAMFGRIHFAFTILGIGLLAGIGVGLAYIIPITVGIQWFPRQKGLVTGVAVAGFGGGAALVSFAGSVLMERLGLPPFDTFAVLGLVFLLLVPAAGSFMRNAPRTASAATARSDTTAIVRDRGFQFLYLAMFTGLATGFAVNANLKQLYGGPSLSAGVAAVSLFAVANALGRIVWGLIVDRFRCLAVIQANLLSQSLVLLAAVLMLKSTTGFLVVSFLFGFNYGGVLVVYASAVAQIWGDQQVAKVYGLLFSANIPAAVAPVLVGFGYDRLGSFGGSLGGLAVLMTAAAILLHRNAAGIADRREM